MQKIRKRKNNLNESLIDRVGMRVRVRVIVGCEMSDVMLRF